MKPVVLFWGPCPLGDLGKTWAHLGLPWLESAAGISVVWAQGAVTHNAQAAQPDRISRSKCQQAEVGNPELLQ